MLSRYIKSCRFVCFSDDDRHKVALEAGGIPFESIGEWKQSDADTTPTMLIGWSGVKLLYPDQNIIVHKISENVFWTYSPIEDADIFKKHISDFVKHSSETFLSVQYESYDAIIDGDFKKFALGHVSKTRSVYTYFSEKAMYVFDGFSEFGFSLESIQYCDMPVRELITWFLIEFDCVVLNYANIKRYVKPDFLKGYISAENAMWVRNAEVFSEKDLLNMFNDRDCGRHIPFLISMLPIKYLNEDEKKSCIRHCVKDAVSAWISERRIYFTNDFENARMKLIPDGNRKYAVLGYSAKTTITGRMHCVEGAFNPQNLAKDSPYRKNIISRFDGGKIVVFDYVSFETKIATHMSGDDNFIQAYRDKDMHAEVAKIAFNWDGIDENIRNIAKNANHALLYGGGETTLEGILVGIENPKKVIIKIRDFLSPLLKKADDIASSYDKIGYIINPFGTLIVPKKRWAAFSNYVSSTASDIVTDKVSEIADFTNNTKSQFIFQVHDSFVFDIHPDEENLIPEIATMLSIHNGTIFQVETSIGDNLLECGLLKSEKKLPV